MRLRKIKLAGFKSFVDPTSIEVPGDLIGIVGPNGCGKSNIIDAVRWVMGEVSAKHLRGESMADVVFSGSGSRKPTGQASVELVFDNTDGRLGGQYASYSEISVKRMVTRDAAQSHYYLNGTRCRRRDVTDVFLGTGLGPRSYAIIEQGMISRLIEAKPEELREFLEEAAGISKYKERRKETQNRISHAQENLDRLNDLREELDKRLQHLKRQATMAEKYKVLKAEERVLHGQLLALKWQSLDAQVRNESSSTGEQENKLEAAIAEQRKLEARIEQIRADHTAKSEQYNESYREVLDVGADIARLEETTQNLRSRQSELDETLQRERGLHAEALRHLEEEKSELTRLNEALAQEQPELERLQQVETGSKAEFGRFEEAMRSLQTAWDTLNQKVAQSSQIMHSEEARISSLDEQIARLEQQQARLTEERGRLRPDELTHQVEQVSQVFEREKQELSAIEKQVADDQSAIDEARQHIQKTGVALNSDREKYQELRGQLASIKRLQEEALGSRTEAAEAWLKAQGLDAAPRLAEMIDVLPGWEKAIEAVLGLHLEAVCMNGTPELWVGVGTQSEGTVSLFDLGATYVRYRSAVHHDVAPLKDKVRAPESIGTLLEGMYAIGSLEEAIQYRGRLGPRESLVTPEGVWVGRNWIRSSSVASQSAGVLSREQDLKSLETQIQTIGSAIESAEASEAEGMEKLNGLESQIAARRRDLAERNRTFAERQSALAAKQAELAKTVERAQAIDNELTELRQTIERYAEQQVTAKTKCEAASREVARLSTERDEYATQRSARRSELDTARERWQAVRDDVYEVGVRAESMRTKLTALNAAATRNRDQADKLDIRCKELAAALEATHEPLREAKSSMEAKLTHRRALEESLDKVRAAVESVESTLREAEQSRGVLDKRVGEERQRLNDLQIMNRETVVRRSTIEEQIAEASQTLEALLAEMPEGAEVGAWEEQIERMDRRINRLGPINLAAIDEYDQQSERKVYLDGQHDDLVEALEMLQQAIRKIDRETRSRFKETFEKVNEGLTELFPRLFGGGNAFLQMTGEDLLDTGISMVARPPGKRNTSIHVLSGGEKALSAVALVFSIFELNPAPFCLLDEVDAPLDEANVGRFCELVKSMTDRVQFMVVTHNKATMEMTQQLLGVTMNEPGISRMVAVDVDEAARLAAM